VIIFGRQELVSFVARVLTPKQFEIFNSVASLQGLTSYAIIRKLSNKHPQSTIKYILKHLRKLGLIAFENGAPLFLTHLGKILNSEEEDDK